MFKALCFRDPTADSTVAYSSVDGDLANDGFIDATAMGSITDNNPLTVLSTFRFVNKSVDIPDKKA